MSYKTLQVCLLLFINFGVIFGHYHIQNAAFDSIEDVNGPRQPRCPHLADIRPCTCTINNFTGTGIPQPDLQCSDVADEDELARVFQADFPTKDIYKLGIYDNRNVKSFYDGMFGEVSFQIVHCITCNLTTVSNDAFVNSVSTLEEIIFQYNFDLSDDDFPFETLSTYTVLQHIDLQFNNFQSLPSLNIPSLRRLTLSFNPISSVPEKPFNDLPNLEDLDIYDLPITELPIGMFEALVSLKSINIGANKATHIKAGTFSMNSLDLEYLNMFYGDVATIEPGTFTGVGTAVINLSDQSLTTVDEDVYRTVLENNAGLALTGNPLECGCDLAWLVLDPNFLGQMAGFAECANGTYIYELDPGYYQDNC